MINIENGVFKKKEQPLLQDFEIFLPVSLWYVVKNQNDQGFTKWDFPLPLGHHYYLLPKRSPDILALLPQLHASARQKNTYIHPIDLYPLGIHNSILTKSFPDIITLVTQLTTSTWPKPFRDAPNTTFNLVVWYYYIF